MKWSRLMLRLVAPKHCCVCSVPLRETRELCSACASSLVYLANARCLRCAVPVAAGSAHHCGECLLHPPPYAKVYSAFEFKGPIEILLKGLKFGRQEWNARPLAALATDEFQRALTEFQPDLLLPVPLSWWRQFRRGYNQSYVLTRALSKITNTKLPLSVDVSRRHHRPQAKRDRESRTRLSTNIFCIPKQSALNKRRILIIDDIMTTGATVRALSTAALSAGAEQVAVFALARVNRNGFDFQT